MLNVVALTGRLAEAPELRETQNGIPYLHISVAVARFYAKEKERVTDFFNVVAWRATAKFIANYFEKGHMIALQGSLQVNKYKDKDGNLRQRTEVLVQQASFAGDKRNRTAPAADEGISEPPDAEPYPDDPELDEIPLSV